MNLPSSRFIVLSCLGVALLMSGCRTQQSDALPNIVYILADDLGYGDVSAYNSNSVWATPNIDRLAKEGMIFTDAHSGSAVCSPTRYGVLTGRYSWRTSLKKGVLWSWDEPLIGEDEPTVGGLLKEKGYKTGCIGKWHLGLGWQYHEADPDSIDFSKALTGGPLTNGFDYFFGITASLDIPPYVWIENDRPTTVPLKYTADSSDMGWWRRGLTGEDFIHDQVLPVITEKAVSFINDHSVKKKPSRGSELSPFFLYIPFTAPHTPILPLEKFEGLSKTNPYGDFVLQVDHSVGRILNALQNNGQSENTLVIFTSDNGCSPAADFDELANFGHDPSYIFRGTKADIFEGGHRIPFIARWPGRITEGSISDQVICLTDLMATAAAISGQSLEEDEGLDSYNLLPLLLGQSDKTLREATVHHSINGSFAIRQGPWKLILCPGSGGWSSPKPKSKEVRGLPPFQLYNLADDPGESTNLFDRYPEKAGELKVLMEKYIREGRSTPGKPQEYIKDENWPGMEWLNETL